MNYYMYLDLVEAYKTSQLMINQSLLRTRNVTKFLNWNLYTYTLVDL